jgi:hypothetical protein
MDKYEGYDSEDDELRVQSIRQRGCCPECGSCAIEYEGGCAVCRSCGYSDCL